MSGKKKLSDDMLDGVSGGVLMLNGESVTSYDVDEGSMTVHTASGSYRYTATDAEKQGYLSNPQKFLAEKAELASQHASTEWEYDLDPGMFKKI